MRARHLLDLGRRHVHAAHADAVAQPTVKIHVADGVPGAHIAGAKCAVSEGLGCRVRVLVVPAGERDRPTLAQNGLSAFAQDHRTDSSAHPRMLTDSYRSA